MPRLSQLLCPTVLALSFLLTGAQAQGPRKIIGYRTATKDEAKAINANHKPSGDDNHDDDDEDDDNKGLYQLGTVGYFYMTNNAPGFPGDDDDWYCIVKGDSVKINAAQKVWVPETYVSGAGSSSNPEKTYLWGGNEDLISEYIQTLSLPGRDGTPDPEKALRLSYVAFSDEERLQMVIPDQVLRDGELDLWAKCFETEEKLEEELAEQPTEAVDWKSWRIAGGAGRESVIWPYVDPNNEKDWPYMGLGNDDGEA
ncbi:hypothetical protein LZ554_001823 [Drepanopeziza brunnea f. sp. 'monogermtubi']|nr:hypothetical protein LZ554_001823 [Drepanopeziza brunnea f. sp. 'monogermtubi']